MKSTSRGILLVILTWMSQGVVAWTSTEQAQTKPADQDQVRLKANLLEVRAVVTDKKGRLIDGLAKDDFEVLENDQPQPIVFFSVERIGADVAAPLPPDKGPGLPARPGGPPPTPARTVVLFVDTLHISPSNLLRTKQALKRFVDQQLVDQDVVRIITSGGALGIVGTFTQNRQMLRYAIDKLMPWSGYSSLFTPYLAAQVDRGDPEALGVATALVQAEEGLTTPQFVRAEARAVLVEAASKRTVMLATLKAAAEQLAEMPGQRLIVLMSDGFSLLDQGGYTDTDRLQSVISRAVRSGVVIYSLDAKGLQPDPMFDASQRGVLTPAMASYSSASEHDAEQGMNALAADTGGKAFFNSNDLNLGLQKALDDNRIYYVLGYYPPEEKNTRFRHIKVRVKDRPDLSVRLPKGYLPREAKPEKEEVAKTPRGRLFQAIAAPLPTNSIGLVALAEYLETEADDAQISLQVHIDAEGLTYRRQEQQYHFELDMATIVYNSAGKPAKTLTDTVQGKLSDERFTLAKQNGFRSTQRIAVGPGLYQVRVGVREPGTERLGTAVAWVDVPNLKKDRLTLSSLFIGQKDPKGELLRSQGAKSLGGETVRQVKQGNALAYSVMIYNASSAPEDLTMQTEILSGSMPFYASGWNPVAARMTGREKKGIMAAGQIVLEDVEPGIYELRLTVQDPKSKKTAHRTVAFEVEA